MVVRYAGETIDSLLRRFGREVTQSGLLREVKRHKHFIPKSQRRRLKHRKNGARQRRMTF